MQSSKMNAVLFVGLTIYGLAPSTIVAEHKSYKTDVLVFGSTPSGISAAVGAAKDGRSVLLVEPTHRLGGLITNGLSHSDFHSRESLSGAFLNFSQRVQEYYAKTFGPDSQQVKDSFGGVFAEPKINLKIFQQMLAEQANIHVMLNHQLHSVQLNGAQLSESELRSIDKVTLVDRQGGRHEIACSMAIDASYEGDLMAMAGVKWLSGREGREEFQESLAPDQADDQLQAYNFRFVMTKEPSNLVVPTAPPGYRREDFLGVLDGLESGEIRQVFGYPRQCIFKAQTPPLPNAKYDINDVSQNLVRLSLPGKNRDWPAGSEELRRTIYNEHLRDQVGLLYFLQNDSAVPEKFQKEARQWGWCRDEFEGTDHLPGQLYVREARRMVGVHVYVQRDSEHAPGDARARLHLDSIAMGDYGNNCHGTHHEGPRFGGKHTGEFYNPVPPYQIPYFVLVPRDVSNLLVPTAVSSSHVGFCSLRLEPIWMSLGQAAGHAAAQAIRDEVPVQQVAVRKLQHRLHQVGAATIYVSDVLPGHPDFEAVQWWGTQGGLHGLNPMPAKPGQRGRTLHGQYCEASPGQAVELDALVNAKTMQRWKAIAFLAGIPESHIPTLSDGGTRGDFVRAVYRSALELGVVTSNRAIPRFHPGALTNTHAPGELDNWQLLKNVITDPVHLSGIVVDDVDAQLVGQWQYSSHTPPYVGGGYLHDGNNDKGTKSARFVPRIARAGWYEVRLSHCYNVRRSTNTPVTIRHADGEVTIRINQQEIPEHAGLFRSLGQYRFLAGQQGWVEISTDGTDGKYVIADATQFLPVQP